MYMPNIPNVKIINYMINFDDKELVLDNLKLTSIPNVEVSNLEECLIKVLKSNRDVTFNTVRYSKKNKTVYFYTDKELDLTKYSNSLNSNESVIFKEIKKVLTEEVDTNDCVSLEEIIRLNNKMRTSYDSLKSNAKANLEHTIQGKYYKPKFEVYDFDYENNIMPIGVSSFNKFEKIYFSKNENGVYIVKSETHRDRSILAMANDELNRMFDEFVKYGNYAYENKRNIESVNSYFLVDINRFNITIKVPTRNFQLNVNSNGSCFYSSKVSGAVDMFVGHEEDILKRLYVKLEDCPSWIQNNINSNIEEYKETNNNTILSRILFPWIR